MDELRSRGGRNEEDELGALISITTNRLLLVSCWWIRRSDHAVGGVEREREREQFRFLLIQVLIN
jgi:hypothetical protein